MGFPKDWVRKPLKVLMKWRGFIIENFGTQTNINLRACRLAAADEEPSALCETPRYQNGGMRRSIRDYDSDDHRSDNMFSYMYTFTNLVEWQKTQSMLLTLTSD